MLRQGYLDGGNQIGETPIPEDSRKAGSVEGGTSKLKREFKRRRHDPPWGEMITMTG